MVAVEETKMWRRRPQKARKAKKLTQKVGAAMAKPGGQSILQLTTSQKKNIATCCFLRKTTTDKNYVPRKRKKK